MPIPKDFKRIYRKHFVITLEWLRDGLNDRRLVPEGLVRVWKDLVIRYGATFSVEQDLKSEKDTGALVKVTLGLKMSETAAAR